MKMFSVLYDCLRAEESECLSLLSNRYHRRYLDENVLLMGSCRAYSSYHKGSLFSEIIIYNEFFIKLKMFCDEVEIKFKNNKERKGFIIDTAEGTKVKKFLTRNNSIVAEVDYVNHEVNAILHFDNDIYIGFGMGGYKEIGRFYRATSEEGRYVPEDFVHTGYSVEYQIVIRFNDKPLKKLKDKKFLKKKLLEGVFIDPYTNADGKQTFRCIVRPDKPFRDAEGFPLNKAKRQELRQLLSEYLEDYVNSPVEKLFNF